MEVAPRYKLLTMLTYTDYAVTYRIGRMGYTPKTVRTTRVPAVLKIVGVLFAGVHHLHCFLVNRILNHPHPQPHPNITSHHITSHHILNAFY